MRDKTQIIHRITENFTILIRNIKFDPQWPVLPISEEQIFSHSAGYFLLDDEVYGQFMARLCNRYPTVAEETIKRHCTSAIRLLLDQIVDAHNFTWDKTFILGERTSSLVDQEQLLAAAEQLMNDLATLVREYLVFVPLMGVELSMPNYDLGPAMLVRISDSLPVIQEADGSAEFQYVHPEIRKSFMSVPCLVQIQVKGDSEFARQEGIRQAGQLAAILNLHLAIWRTSGDAYQKIQCAGIPSSTSRVVLVRTDLPDESGTPKPTYQPGVSNRGFMKQQLNQTQLNAVKQSGFDVIWRCFEQSHKRSKSLEERIRRAVMWFDKAVNFDEPDAQFVGLATALEILLVSEASINNVYSTWSGITQQLADRCAFLLGHDLESTLEVAKRVKELYKVRSGIVHGGKEPTTDELDEMIRLTSRVIVDFVQRDFLSFEDFEDWIRRLQYSVNINEIDRYMQNRD